MFPVGYAFSGGNRAGGRGAHSARVNLWTSKRGRRAPPKPHGSLAGASPESRRSTSDSRSEVLRRDSGEAPARPRGGYGPVSGNGPPEWRGFRTSGLASQGGKPGAERSPRRGKPASRVMPMLTEQPITPAGPGSILKDVDSFLEFVGTEGIATKSRSSTLPSGRLTELNQKSSYPVELTLKRALLRDYPNLAGIFVLLRVMDLLQVKGPRLTVCPTAPQFWRGLNCTQQYFALLEALLFRASHSTTATIGNSRFASKLWRTAPANLSSPRLRSLPAKRQSNIPTPSPERPAG
jgi:hypothetical protein